MVARSSHKFNLGLSDTTYNELNEAVEAIGVSIADLLRDSWDHYSWMLREYQRAGALSIQVNGREVVFPRLEQLAEALRRADS